MNSTRETIIETLAVAGITGLSVEDVIGEFNTSDELAGYLATAEDAEQAVLAHLPEYLAFKGLVMTPTDDAPEVDPTQTQPSTSTAGAAMPSAVTAAEMSALSQVLSTDLKTLTMRSEQSEMIAVLIDKPYPGEWMESLGKLHVNGEAANVLANLKKQYHPDADINELIKVKETTFIPSTEQLKAYQVIDSANHANRRTTPSWYDFDNTAALNAIQSILTDGDGTFDVMIAPREDEGSGIKKNKAWRWNTKGFVVRMPSADVGSSSMEEKVMSREQLLGFMLTDVAGHITSKKTGGLGCKLVKVKKKKKDISASAQAEELDAVLRITGNNLTNKPELRVVSEQTGERGKMTVRSDVFYLAIRVGKNGEPYVKKVRLPLAWESAPVWRTKSEYVKLFPNKVKGGIGTLDAKGLQEVQEARLLLASQIMAKGSVVAAEGYNLGAFLQNVEETVNKNAAQAAAEIGL